MMSKTWNWFGWNITGWGILQILLFILLFIIGVNSCDYRTNKLLTEQSTTFEKELAYKQRRQNELEYQVKTQQEKMRKLERQLECLDGDK